METPKTLHMPDTGDIYQEELHKGSGSKLRERIMFQATKLKGIRYGATGFGVCLSRFQFCLGLIFLYYTLIPSL